MPYTCKTRVESQHDTLGQSWHGESIPENIDLCGDQPIGEYFQKYLGKEDRILEAGCGMGRWVFYLRDRGYNIVGVDTSKEAIEMAKQYDPSVAISLEDVSHMSFADGSFEAVISLGVMEHFPEGPQGVLAETRRLLSDDGLLFVTIPVANVIRTLYLHPREWVSRMRHTMQGQTYAFSEYRYSVREFSRHLRASGFDIKEIVTDELVLPKNLGLYVDFANLRHNELKWTLNDRGLRIARFMNRVSDSLSRGGVLFICRKSS